MGEAPRIDPSLLPAPPASWPSGWADQPAVEVHRLEKTYGSWFGPKVKALRGVTLRVERGEVFGLLGPNGAGKTTLVKILLGICRLTAGDARILGTRVPNLDIKRWIGYLPENHRFPRHHTARTLLDFYVRLEGLAPREYAPDRDKLLQLVGLTAAADRPLGGYSKGMLQRLGLAAAILHGPQLLFLDEPTDGVDPMGRREIRDILACLKKQGRTIFLNSHILSEIELICDRVAILNEGQLVQVGTVEELTASRNEYYLEVDAPSAELAAALESQLVFLRPENKGYRLAVEDPGDLDTLVDLLRQRGVGLRALVPKRASLEERFIDIVTEHRPGEATGGEGA